MRPVSSNDTITPNESFDTVVSTPDMEPPTSPTAPQLDETANTTVEAPVALSSTSETTSTSTSFATPAPVSAPQPEVIPPVTPSVAAATVPPANTSSGSAMTGSKKPKTKAIVIGALVGVLVLLGAGGTAAYAMYQQPDRVVADGMANIVKAKMTGINGTVTIASADVDVTVALTSKSSKDSSAANANVKVKMKSGELSGKEFDVVANSVVVKDGTMYIKLTNLDKAFDAYIDAAFAANQGSAEYGQLFKAFIKEAYMPTINALNNQWIKITADDLKSVDQSSGNDLKCLTDTVNKVRDDKQLSKQVADAYKANTFVIVKEKLGTKEGNMGYLIDLNEDKAQKFSDSLQSTEIGTSLKSCLKDTSSDTSKSEGDTIKNGRLEVWVSKWSHQIMHVTASGEDSSDSKSTFSLDMTPSYNNYETVDVPKDAKSIKELQDVISPLLFTSTGTSSSSSSIQL